MSCPSKSTRPPVGFKSRIETRPTVVLPDPDSPTTARVSPCATVRLTPETAVTKPPRKSPLRVWKTIDTSSSASNGPDSGATVRGMRSVSVKSGPRRAELHFVALPGDDRVVQPAARMSTIWQRDRGWVVETCLEGVGTAGMKATPRRERGEVGRVARHGTGWHIRMKTWQRSQQELGVRMARRDQHPLGGTELHLFAGVGHRDAVAEIACQADVV